MSDLHMDNSESESGLADGLQETSEWDFKFEDRPADWSLYGRNTRSGSGSNNNRGRNPSRLKPAIRMGSSEGSISVEQQQTILSGDDPAGPNARHSTQRVSGESGPGDNDSPNETPPSGPAITGVFRDESDGRYGEGVSNGQSESDGMATENPPSSIPRSDARYDARYPGRLIDDARQRIANGPKTLSELQNFANPLQRAPSFEKAIFEAQVVEAKYMADGQFIIRLAVPTSQGCDEAQKLGKAFGIMLQVGVYRKRYVRQHPEELENLA